MCLNNSILQQQLLFLQSEYLAVFLLMIPASLHPMEAAAHGCSSVVSLQQPPATARGSPIHQLLHDDRDCF